MASIGKKQKHTRPRAGRPSVKQGTRSGSRSGESPSRELTRDDGREVRRMTVYLPIEMAKRLAMYSVEHDRNMSDVVAEALEKILRS